VKVAILSLNIVLVAGRRSGLIASALRKAFLPVFLALAVLAVFSPVLRNGFVGYDDPDYVTSNPRVNTGLTMENARWALTAAHAGNWHPLTWFSHQLDCSLFGLDPAGHHFTSLLLHALNTALLFLWLAGATGRRGRSAFVALAFGLHPLHVESVAWVAERKDVLSTLFLMLALLAYSAYVKQPGTARFFLVAALLAAGLMAKPMVVTLPLLLWMLDLWPYRRRGRPGALLLEKLPLLALSAVACVLTLWAQRQGGSVAELDRLPLSPRLANAAVSYVRYLGKTVWPSGSAVFYPFPFHGLPWWLPVLSLAGLAVAAGIAFAARRERPWLALGLGWYLVALLPVIGVVQVGMQAMADRYMYVPMIGLLIAMAWQGGEWLDGWHAPPWLAPAIATVALFGCAALSWRQLQVWKDGIALFTHALQVTRDNFVAHDNLGVELDRAGRFDEALAQYRETLRIRPGDRNGEQNYAMASFAQGERLLARGSLDEALACFREGLRYRPNSAAAHTYAGLILTQQNRITEAIPELRRAIQLDPTQSRAYVGLGVALARDGQLAEAEQILEEAVRLDPANREARYDLDLIRREGPHSSAVPRVR
jgi:tetratricopeptide (TPR) repeat protein